MITDEIYIKRFTEKDVMPLDDGQYSTDRGYIELWHGKWCDVEEEPEWWIEPISKSDCLESMLPEEAIDETFIENEISYQHHGVVRMAINKYKKWVLEKLSDKE